MSIYYNPPETPTLRSPLSSEQIRDSFGALDAAFNLLPDPVGGGSQGFAGGLWNESTLHACTLLDCILGTDLNPSKGVVSYLSLSKSTQATAGVGNVMLYRDLDGVTRFMDVATTAFMIDQNQNVVPGNGATELSTASVKGFFYLPSVNGTSVGTPLNVYGGAVPMVYNRATHKIGAFSGTWKYTAALT